MPPSLLCLILVVSLYSQLSSGLNDIEIYEAKLLATEAHNANWFTQGLYLDGDNFIISSGLYGRSQIIIQGPTGTLSRSLADRYFAEGLTLVNNRIYLLTWKKKTLLVFDKNNLNPLGQFYYHGQGWGLTHTDKAFIMSNGTNQLQFRDLQDFSLLKTSRIDGLDKINELEYINGILWANRWYDDNIYALEPNKGCLMASIDISHLRLQATAEVDRNNVTNGIAYDASRQGLWVTGKYWSKRFLIKLPEINAMSCHDV